MRMEEEKKLDRSRQTITPGKKKTKETYRGEERRKW